MAKAHNVDDVLLPWPETIELAQWSGLLIGNGASRATWDAFAYTSLLDAAKNANEVEHPLTEADLRLFTEMDTQNFERVLAALKTASVVARALGLDSRPYDERYDSIQRSLVEAVHRKHIPWGSMLAASKTTTREELLRYEVVYSTNYDLLVYWAIMHEAGDGFKDYFWAEDFKLADTDIYGKCTRVFYLHGGLHLYRTPAGATLKRRAEAYQNLLDLFGTPMHDDAVPLFIAEGTSPDKLASIYRSDYLSFAYSQFLRHSGPLVVFGHALGDSDQHIVDAIRKADVKQLAVSMLPGNSENVISQKAALVERFPLTELTFFDATTHPLGKAELKVRPA